MYSKNKFTSPHLNKEEVRRPNEFWVSLFLEASGGE
jgi:hypothetical protein